MKTKLFITGVAFFAMTSLGFSQNGQPQDKPGRNTGNCQSWIDENKNGVCDNYENRSPAQARNGNGNGFCGGRNQGQQGKGMMNGQGRGRNFVDADKNGVCDRSENQQKDQVLKK
jgi:hypothetical protein